MKQIIIDQDSEFILCTHNACSLHYRISFFIRNLYLPSTIAKANVSDIHETELQTDCR
jgi:hypothetical protein